MGKVTGFMEFGRIEETHLAPGQRVKNYREFTMTLVDDQAREQGARCMDCGIPFCNNACPIHNLIPDWNDLVYRGKYKLALDKLQATNNFPEFTGRICPAPCEPACCLGVISEPVGIRSIERFIIEKGWEEGWVVPHPAKVKSGKKVAIVGSGPAGLSAAQQLVRAGHDVVVFEKNDKIGGLLRYGIPDFKLEKQIVDRRLEQMKAEGVVFRTGVLVGKALPSQIQNMATEVIDPQTLEKEFDAVILACGAEQPRTLDVPGADLQGVHYAMEFLCAQNRKDAGERGKNRLSAEGKRVVIIGGGDTGSDCVGIANRQGAASILQIDRNTKLPETIDKSLVWPYWPKQFTISSSQEEGCERDFRIQTKRIEGKRGKVEKIIACRVNSVGGRYVDEPGSEFFIEADMVLLAMGFAGPAKEVLDAFGVQRDMAGNVMAAAEGEKRFQTSVEKVFAAGDTRRGQSLVVWALHEGRECAAAVDRFLTERAN